MSLCRLSGVALLLTLNNVRKAGAPCMSTDVLRNLLPFIMPLCQTESERRALLNEALVNAPLLREITFGGSAHTFAVNMLSVLARSAEALDALLDVLKDRYDDPPKAAQIEVLRPALHAWAAAGADPSAFDVSAKVQIVLLAATADAFTERLQADLTRHNFALLPPEQLDRADRVLLLDAADPAPAHARCKPILYLWRAADASPHAEALAFRADSDYSAQFERLLARLRQPVERLGRVSGTHGLPDYYIRRETAFQSVVDSLINQRNNLAAISAVQGMAGIGKSVLAEAVLAACDVRRAFPDGLIRLEVGDSPDYAYLQRRLAEHLGLDTSTFDSNYEGNRDRLKRLLEGKRLLILLDNVWDAKAVEAFRLGLSGCTVLFTTRKERIATALGATLTPLGVLSAAEGSALILKLTGFPAEALVANDQTAGTLAAQIGTTLRGHTLAISIAASRWQQKGMAAGKAVLNDYQALLSDVPPDQPFSALAPDPDADQELGEASDALKPDLRKVFDLSYADLNDDFKRRFRQLGILATECTFTAEAAAALWSDPSPETAREKLDVLVRLALLTRTEDGRYTQHNLLRLYAHSLLRQQNELSSAERRHFTYFFDQRHVQRAERTALSADLPNILLALRFASQDDPYAAVDWAMKLAKPMRGMNLTERRAILAVGLAAAERDQNATGRAFLLNALCEVAQTPEEGQRFQREALSAFAAATASGQNVIILQMYALAQKAADNFDEARRLLEEGLRHVHDGRGKGLLHSALGGLLAGGQAPDLSAAEAHFRKALEYDARNALTHYHFAVRVLLPTKRRAEACQHLCRAKALHPRRERDRKMIEDALWRNGCTCG